MDTTFTASHNTDEETYLGPKGICQEAELAQLIPQQKVNFLGNFSPVITFPAPTAQSRAGFNLFIDTKVCCTHLYCKWPL